MSPRSPLPAAGLRLAFLQAVHGALPREGGAGQVGLQAGLQQTRAHRASDPRHHVRVCSPYFTGGKRWQMEHICLPKNTRVWSVFQTALDVQLGNTPQIRLKDSLRSP